MNLKLREVFPGKVVNKSHTINTGVDEFPRYVVEYLIDNYCSEETFHSDMEMVVRRLKENFVHGAEAEKYAITSGEPAAFGYSQSGGSISGDRRQILGEHRSH